ncbi:MAG: SGNH/GDSL hydrolase family protein [Clostridiales bacterium]|jgi:lysophospholipase L1-like esterase|nr:SGNH/GDSL hydrolase family protein [Clostridiales bacterium]
MTKILLLGDSIRENYQEKVKELLFGDNCEIFHPDENCRFSRYTLNSLKFWLPMCPNPDIVHWNNGLWDTLITYPEDGPFTEISEYVRDMKRILRELKKTGAKVIFATTTAVGDNNPPWSNETIEEYNKALIDAIGKDVDAINDLYALTRPNNATYISAEDKVHLTPEGIDALGSAVTKHIRKFM